MEEEELTRRAATGETEEVWRLLRLGASPTWEHSEALRGAARHGHAETVAALLKAGADARALERRLSAVSDDPPLALAAREGHPEALEKLIQYGASVNAQNELALRLAGESRHRECWSVLGEAGADPQAALLFAKEIGARAQETGLIEFGPYKSCVYSALFLVVSYYLLIHHLIALWSYQ